jgi:outer membrane protein OmpA-like peptidoglycan-associated protein
MEASVRTNRSLRPTSLWISVGVAAVLALAGGSPAAAQLGALRDATRRAADEAKKAEEARKNAEEAKKTTEDLAGKKDQPSSTAPATPAGTAASGSAASNAPAFATYSKFDFVPGETVVIADDFTQDAVGDFPAKWNTNASGEIVTVGGTAGHWLKFTRAGFFVPEYVPELPENFTFEFDLLVEPEFNGGFALNTSLVQLSDLKRPADWQSAANVLTFTAHPATSAGGASSITTRQDGTSGPANQITVPNLLASRGAPVHVSVWRQRQRVRIYMNQEKVWDVPRAIADTAKFNSIVFFIPGGCGNCDYYVSNLRVATGAPDTRNKILTEGKWISHGILFDVNSDRLKGESYGSLKEISGVLSENPGVKVQIVGHTDSDGDDASNLDLSKRRAAAVKTALVSEFKIDAGRLETDGKGETQPIDKNDTPAGKANNRRVEFIKR